MLLDPEAYLVLQILRTSEIYPEHPQESLRLRAAVRVMGEEEVVPQLLLDPHGFITARQQFIYLRRPRHSRDARSQTRTCGAQKVRSMWKVCVVRRTAVRLSLGYAGRVAR